MPELLILFVVVILLACVAIWALQTLGASFGLPPQIRAVIQVLIVVLVVCWIAYILLGHAGNLGVD